MYSIAGKNMHNPLASSLANFVVAIPFVVLVYLFFYTQSFIQPKGMLLALLSGGLASSGAYVLWYAIVKKIDRVTASSVQLSVPCLAILGGALFIGEALSFRIHYFCDDYSGRHCLGDLGVISKKDVDTIDSAGTTRL